MIFSTIGFNSESLLESQEVGHWRSEVALTYRGILFLAEMTRQFTNFGAYLLLKAIEEAIFKNTKGECFGIDMILVKVFKIIIEVFFLIEGPKIFQETKNRNAVAFYV